MSMKITVYPVILAIICIATIASSKKPNLVIVMTDEHNIRTLSCYRSLMWNQNPLIWGEGVKVNTPNIDSLARDGAIFTNFNAVSPLCTPSRASFLSGLYPKFTGRSWKNHGAMDEDVVTFAEILQTKAGYATGFVGKWHLNGDEKPGFANEERRFGFHDITYQFNRGHWKLFEEDIQTGEINAYDWEDRDKLQGEIEDAYATDFLFRKGIDFMKRKIEEKKHFALMISIPDPHGPNDVRPPYDNMYNNMSFKLPLSAVTAHNRNPALPGWSALQTDLETADETIEAIESNDNWQRNMRNYFGMVKLVDDKFGELLSFLKDSGQDENTIVVFTSDHGDMMGEHGKHNKGTPYQSSAGVPCIIRHLGHIRKKIINTAYSSPDFAPTILSLMGVDYSGTIFQGIDGSDEILDYFSWTDREQVRFITDSQRAKWASAVDRHFKLVLGKSSPPWLFDLKSDPYEIYNHYEDPSYNQIIDNLEKKLLNAIELYDFPLGDIQTVYIDDPICLDTKDQIPYLPYRICSDLSEESEYSSECESDKVRSFCPETCGICCEDSPGILRHNGKELACDYFIGKRSKCEIRKIATFCPVTCSKCTQEPSSSPSASPSYTQAPNYMPSLKPSNIQSNMPSNPPFIQPTIDPTAVASSIPTNSPTDASSGIPSNSPMGVLSNSPTIDLSNVSSIVPSGFRTTVPSNNPTATPSRILSDIPTGKSSYISSNTPTASTSSMIPNSSHTAVPSTPPTSEPAYVPFILLTENPVSVLSTPPTSSPRSKQSRIPTDSPTAIPLQFPNHNPTITLSPSSNIESNAKSSKSSNIFSP